MGTWDFKIERFNMHMEGVEIAGGAYSIITYPKNVVSWFSKLDDISFFYEKFGSIASCYTRKNGECLCP